MSHRMKKMPTDSFGIPHIIVERRTTGPTHFRTGPYDLTCPNDPAQTDAPLWTRTASAAPLTATSVEPPHLAITTWPDSDEPFIVACLRPEQMQALAPGFARWTGDHVEVPSHRRGLVERTPGGASLIIAGVLVASGTVRRPPPGWTHADRCTVGLYSLADHRDELLNEFVEILARGQALVAEMAVVDVSCADFVCDEEH